MSSNLPIHIPTHNQQPHITYHLCVLILQIYVHNTVFRSPAASLIRSRAFAAPGSLRSSSLPWQLKQRVHRYLWIA